MKIKLQVLFITLVLFAGVRQSFAQGTAFTYQGRLNSGSAAANGSYDVTFALFATNTTGVALAGPVTNAATAVSNGLFTVTIDFGNQFPGADRWLEIGVRTNGGSAFTTLSPRQQLTPTPYAIFAANAGSAVTAATAISAGSAGSVAAANITGALTPSQLPAGVITNGASSVNFAGTFAGNGAGVTNLNLAINSGGAIYLTGGFILTSTVTNVGQPSCVAIADVNGDGKPDLISANFDNGLGNTLSVLTNNGSGGFGLSATLIVGTAPASLISADVNGDGKPDLISANEGSAPNYFGTLSVLTNDGSGGFVLASSPSVGKLAISVAAADVNGDGKMDLISANYADNTLTVLTNNGSGGFGLSATLNVGNSPNSVVSADVNGDGKPDLICANYFGDNLTVLTNNGSGGFAVASSPGTGSRPASLAVADVNRDGKPDLISANRNDSTLTVLTNNGSGGFVLSASPGVGIYPDSVVSAGVNGDGKADLISANYNDNTLTVLTNDGSGGFGPAATLSVGKKPVSVTAADVNGDGKLDLICANLGSTSLSILLNSPAFNGAFSGAFSGDGSGLTALNASNLVGENTAASGRDALATGFHTIASGVNSTAIGNQTMAAGQDSTSMGQGSIASGIASVAMGMGAQATNMDAIAMGYFTTAGGSASTAMGYQTTASGNNSTAMGNTTAASGYSSTAMGSGTTASGYSSTAMGYGTIASGIHSFASGESSTASALAATAMGYSTLASAPGTTALGVFSQAIHNNTFVWSDGTVNPFSSTGTNQFLVNAAGGVGINTSNPNGAALAVNGIATVSGSLNFGSQTRQMLNLYGTNYGIGVQNSSLYFRCDNTGANSTDGFIWYKGGVHTNAYANPGVGGTELMHLIQGGLYVNGTFVSSSDRNAKENFQGVDAQAVLAKVATLPLSRWNYKADKTQEHLGPMAQDFYAAFNVGPDDKHITTIDESGVALAAIQGLNQKLEADAKAKDAEIESLKQNLAGLKQLVQSLAEKK